MSELYTSEPPTSGKVIVETNYGNIDIELFTLEAPKSCRNFIQHCLNKYYNGCIFFKIFKNFMIQTGDPTNTGNGGESIYHEDFRDEFHSRLKFSHRGIVAMANKNKPNSNGSQFFITLDKCSQMDKKYTIFGKVTGPTFFNAVTISNLSANEDGVPSMKDEEKPRITNTQVVINPFKDLKPTVIIKDDGNSGEKSKKKKKPKKLKIKYSADKMFFQDSEDESENNDNKEIKEKNDNNVNKDKKEEQNELKEEKDNKVIIPNDINEKINENKERQNENIEDKKINEKTEEDKKEDNVERKEEIEEKNNKDNKNEKKINKETENNNNEDKDEDGDEENENSEESESKSLSSDDHEVKNAKELLVDDEENIRKNKRKNIEDYKREINLLRKKVKKEKEEVYNEEAIKKRVEEEKLTKMDILQKYNHNYVKTNQANKLSNDERVNKLKNFKSFIGGGDSERWYKTKLKFQTDSQKAFALDMINKELEKNGNGNMDDNI